ncbi:nitroreductase [Polymorphum gilvum]|uniref:Nitroreductase family n=1 Tax=Polymorphum gilvum (strain LMG 25793 / CGMCC 1.9160 / SL003B-26A1) TaxID=991905 RepID=F2J1H2_POLGS|nr:nitroreductase [Polymorphum gilvum]ADZ69754.1 Nitroreductase family [Polymorphum gilvum SL003B-26A1]
MKVSEALASRISCRAFLPEPVPLATVRAILEGAARAPSGGNLQPWHVHVLTGAPLKALIADIAARTALTPRGEGTEYAVYPPDLKEPYAARRFKCGEDMYRLLGVEREDRKGRGAQFRRNFELFGAPVGLFVYLDRTMGPPQWADCGMFLQSVMLLAREHGLHTCAQEAWAQWHGTLAEHLSPPAEHMFFCTIALGRMDETAPVNRLKTERAAVDDFARFLGF